MRSIRLLALALLLGAPGFASAREPKLVRYPDYHEGKVAFCYLGDLWTADINGQNLQRLTVHKARDVYPRFSPDGKWIAFSSDRNGNLDVFLIPSQGGAVKPLTFHSADDVVLGWTPDGQSVLFASQRGEDFMGKLYTVSIDGGMPRDAGPDMGVYASYSPDGKKLAINRRAQSYWRKYYRGAYQSDVTVMDLASKTFKDLTDFKGMDSWPLWAADGHIYFVSDREGKGLTNLWRVPENGGEAERITTFTSGDVRFPEISGDGTTIVFEHDFGIWKLDLATKEVRPIPLDINAETQESLTEYREFNSQADDFALAPSGKRIAVSIHGEIFTAPTDQGDLVQITNGAARDRDVEYSPDGKWITYVSDASGREEIYIAPADGTGKAKKLTDIDALKSSYCWSPDAKEIAFTTSDGKLYKVGIDGQEAKELVASKYGNISRPAWSPDGKWIAYSRPDVSRTTDIYLIPRGGGEEKKITFDSYNDTNPRFSADGKKLYFVRAEGGLERFGGERPETQLYVLPLERLEKDPDDNGATTEETDSNDNSPEAMRRRLASARAPKWPVGEVKIDWSGLKRRTRRVTRSSAPIFSYTPAWDSKTLVFVASDGPGGRGIPTLYAIQDDGKRLTRITSGSPPPTSEGEDGPRGLRGRFGGISTLYVSRDGRSVFFKEGDGIYSAPLLGGAGAGGSDGPGGGGRLGALAALTGPTGGPGSGGGSRKKIAFTVKVKIDRPAEWAEMFGDAWRTMKYRFYDPKMHGQDWDAARVKYEPLVQYVGDRQELMNVINEMIGELNASHTGASAGRGRAEGAVQTGHLGLDLVPDDEAGRYKVKHVYEDGPCDKDWVKVSPGDYLIAIDGKPVTAGDNYYELLNRRLNRRVRLTLNSKPTEEGAWTVRIEPISMTAFSQLRYDRWVKERRELVDKLSEGRIGYLHIKAMDSASLRKFEKELREFRHKEGLVIDERWNGGGNIDQELLGILVQRPYQVWQPRGTEPTERPFSGYFGPKVVLQNWRSASNAEMFPAGFRALGLGKVIGTPTMGAVIGTGSYTLIDGSTIRTPGVGVYLANPERTNLENYGVQPDLYVENTPEDNLAGRDRQLEVAVQEVLKQLKPKEEVAGGQQR